ncbi:MAG: tetratricopeptide repeat protein [Caulobacteraceae bacterium]
MTDFIEEVDEQLRSDRYRTLARRAAPWFLAAFIAVVVGWVGVWGYNTWQDRNIGKASIAYDKALTSLAQGDETGAYTGFEALGRSGPAGYKTLGLMQQGNIRLAAGKGAEAAVFYDAAARAAPNAILRDLERLRAAQALLDTAPYPQIQTRLAAIIGDKKPFDLEAREALAMAKLMAGKTAEARGDFNALTLTLGVSEAMRGRVQAAIALIDAGEAANAVQVVKAAALLPPPKQPAFGAQGGDGGAPQDQGAPQGAPDTAPGNAQ